MGFVSVLYRINADFYPIKFENKKYFNIIKNSYKKLNFERVIDQVYRKNRKEDCSEKR